MFLAIVLFYSLLHTPFVPLNAETGLLEPLEAEVYAGESGEFDGCRRGGHGIATEICGLTETDNVNEAIGQEDVNMETFDDDDDDDDVIFSEEQKIFLTRNYNDVTRDGNQQRVVVEPNAEKSLDYWPIGKKIPYEIDASLVPDGEKAINEGIEHIEKYTCVRFKARERDKDRYFLRFVKSKRCSSKFGRRKNLEWTGQVINLAPRCFSKGPVAHEIMHAFGFLHEQQRNDRDKYIKINWQNIIPVRKKNFRLKNEYKQNFLGTDYDYNSVMHYPRDKFSKNGKDTITILGCPKNKTKIMNTMGQMKGLSASDRYRINKLFKCPGATQRQLGDGEERDGPNYTCS